MIKLLSCFFILLVVHNPTCAVDIDLVRQDTVKYLDVVVVTATRSNAKNFDAPEPVSKINRSTVEILTPMSTPELASYIPGVWMQKTNHGGGSPYIRGLTGYHTLLVFDGIRFNNSIFRSGPNQYLNTIDLWTLEEIEVLHGSGSVQYGSDGIGGTLQLFSRDLSFNENEGWRVNGNAAAKFLSHDMEKTGRVEVQTASKRLAFRSGFTHKDFGNIQAGEGIGVLPNTGYNEHSWDIKSKVKLNELHTATFLYQHLSQNEIPIYHQLVAGKFSRYHTTLQQRQMAYVKLESTYGNKLIDQIRYTLSYQKGKEIREKQATGSDVLKTETDEVTTMGLVAEIISHPLTNWSVSSGVEIYHDEVGSSAVDKNFKTDEALVVRGLYPDASRYLNAGIFSLHTFDVNRFTFTGGIRFNYFSLSLDDVNFGITTIQPKTLVGNAGLLYKASNTTHFVATAGTGFRSPNINDVASLGITDFRYEVPNYNLAPEKSFQYQAGVKINGRKNFISLYAYRNRIFDMITNLPSTYQGQDSINGFQVYQRFNSDKAIIKGIEFEVHQKINQSFNLTGSLTYTLGDNVNKKEPVSRIPPLFGRVAIFYQLNKLTTTLDVAIASKQDRLSGGDKKDSRIAAGGTPAWTTVNFRAQYKFKRATIQVSAINIFNEAYRVHGSGVDGIGRSYSLTALVNF